MNYYARYERNQPFTTLIHMLQSYLLSNITKCECTMVQCKVQWYIFLWDRSSYLHLKMNVKSDGVSYIEVGIKTSHHRVTCLLILFNNKLMNFLSRTNNRSIVGLNKESE